jgi:hypothetical protein
MDVTKIFFSVPHMFLMIFLFCYSLLDPIKIVQNYKPSLIKLTADKVVVTAEYVHVYGNITAIMQ